MGGSRMLLEDLTMPGGSKAKIAPADVIGNAVKVMRIATGEEPKGFGRKIRSGSPRPKTETLSNQVALCSQGCIMTSG